MVNGFARVSQVYLRPRLGLFSPSGYGFAGFLIGGATAFGLALVPLLFALCEGEFYLDFAILKVHAGGDQRESLLLRLSDQFSNFFFVDQELAGAKRGVVGVVAVVIRADMAVEEPEFAILDQAVGIFQICRAGAYRFDLGPGQNHPSLEFFEQEVVMARVPVYGSVPFPGRGGLAARILFSIRLRLVCGLLGHSANKSAEKVLKELSIRFPQRG